MKSLRKELRREIRGSRARFLSILVMVALGVLFLVGLRSAAPDMRDTAERYFDSAGLYDIQILSTLGLTAEDVDAFARTEGVASAEGGWSLDGLLTAPDQTQAVVKLVSLMETTDHPTVLEGRLPETSGQCALDEKLLTTLDVSLGDTVTLATGEAQSDALAGNTFTVTGIVDSPLYISLDRGTSTLGDGSVSGFVLLAKSGFTMEQYTVASIAASGTRALDAYGDAYDAQIDALSRRLEDVAEARAALRYDTLVSDARVEIDRAQSELDDAKAEAETGFAEAQAEIDRVRGELDAGWDSLEQAKMAVEYGLMAQSEADALEQTLLDGEQDYQDGLAQLEQARADAEAEFAGGQADMDDARAQIDDIRPADVYVLTRDSNYGFVSYDQNATRMENLARVFPVIFFLVAALVCLTTMTRMVEEERTQIGAIKAMGYGTGAIAWKFLVYGVLAASAGAAVGAVIGTTLIPWVIFTSYGIMYKLPALRLTVHWGLCLGAGLAGIACTVAATLWAMLATARQSPASLMRPKAPQAGKRILLERVTPIWRHMRFSAKVSARNLFRYKKRFWMTVIGVAGCTALLIAGLGLRSSIFNIIDIQFGDLYRYDVTLSVDPDQADVETAVETALEASGNLDSMAWDSTRSVTFQASGRTADGYLTVTDDPDALAGQIDLRTLDGHRPLTLSSEGVLIDEKLAELLDVGPGDMLTIDCGTRIEVPVAGVREHYVYHYAYMTGDVYTALTGEPYRANEALVTVRDDGESAVSVLCGTLMSIDGVQSASNLTAMAKSFRETMEVVDAAVLIIILSAAALALVVLYNLTNINITERVRELATIKVLGFYDGEVAMYIYRENIVLTALGIALGQPLGKLLCTWLVRTIEMEAIMFGREALPHNYLLSIVLSLGFAVLVNVLMYFRMQKIDMVQSLKSVE